MSSRSACSALFPVAVALAVLPVAGAAQARTRSFCSVFGISPVNVTCGGHLQPTCSSSPPCGLGFEAGVGALVWAALRRRRRARG